MAARCDARVLEPPHAGLSIVTAQNPSYFRVVLVVTAELLPPILPSLQNSKYFGPLRTQYIDHIWRKPPSHNAFNAPTHPSPLPVYNLKSFHRAKLTFTLPPANQLRQYDQAGLLLHFTKPGLAANQTKWIKTGIEFYYGMPYVATVGCDEWADWSLTPDSSFESNCSGDARPTATIEAKRERDALGKSLWVYLIVRDGAGKEVGRRPLREVTWVFAEEEGWSVGIGGYVCRPTEEGGEEELMAEFGEGVEIEVLKE